MISFNFHNNPIGWHYYYPPFKDEEIKAYNLPRILLLETDGTDLNSGSVDQNLEFLTLKEARKI